MNFEKGDLISIQIPRKGEVGPIGMSGTVVKDLGSEVYYESGHSNGEYFTTKKEYCSLIKAAKKGK